MDNKKPQENKMGVLPIGRLLFGMSLPIMISMLVQALYNIVDSMFVARISEEALTALSMAFPLQMLMIALGGGLGVGVNAMLSRSLGAKDEEGVSRAAMNGLFLYVLAAALFMVLGLTVVRPFFSMQTDIPGIVENGVTYATIVLTGSFGIFMQFLFERMLQGTGRTVQTMITQTTGAVINIILDPILIFGLFGFPKMGVAGAAVATIFGQWVAGAFAIFMHLRTNVEVKMQLRGFRPHLPTIRRILAIGIPSVVMQSIGSVMNFLMNMILIAFTPTAVAVFGIYFKLQSFIFMPVFGLNNGTIPIVAYSYGARRPDRLMQAVRYSIATAVIIMLAGTALFQLAPQKLLGIFDASDELLAIGVPALRIISLSFASAGFCIGCGTVFQALGQSIYSMIISVIRQIVVLVPCAYLLGRITGSVSAVWWSFVIAEGVSLLLSAVFFKKIYDGTIKKL